MNGLPDISNVPPPGFAGMGPGPRRNRGHRTRNPHQEHPMTITITRRQAVAAALIALIAAVALIATGCANKFMQPFKDSPRSAVVNDQPAEVIYMPDGFNNLATKCDHGNRIYVSYHGDGSYGFGFAIPDPACGG